MTGRRLFFALWPDNSVRKEIAAIARQIPCPEGRCIADNNLHITLAFLGTVSEPVYQQLGEMAGQIQSGPVSVCLDSLGYWKKPRIICLLPTHIAEQLSALKQRLDQGLQSCGLAIEQRPYRPHVSLYRNARRAPQSLEFAPIDWTAHEFCLVQSETRPSGVEYRVLQRWPLQN